MKDSHRLFYFIEIHIKLVNILYLLKIKLLMFHNLPEKKNIELKYVLKCHFA